MFKTDDVYDNFYIVYDELSKKLDIDMKNSVAFYPLKSVKNKELKNLETWLLDALKRQPELLLEQHPVTQINIGMLCACLGFESTVIKALRNPIIATQRDKNGANIGMSAARAGLEKATIVALDDEVAQLQQDYVLKCNIGMFAAQSNMEKACLKALDNTYAIMQRDVFGKNIKMYCDQNHLELATSKATNDTEEAEATE